MDRPTAGQAYSRTPISKSNGSINFHTPNQKVMVGVVLVPSNDPHLDENKRSKGGRDSWQRVNVG